MTTDAKHEDRLAALPAWAAHRIRQSPVPIDQIWDEWTNDLPVAMSKRAAFAASTRKTIAAADLLYSAKSCDMLTDALLKYYTLPDASDLEHPMHGVYGWSRQAAAA